MKNKKFKIFKKLQYSLEKKSGKRQFFLWNQGKLKKKITTKLFYSLLIFLNILGCTRRISQNL